MNECLSIPSNTLWSRHCHKRRCGLLLSKAVVAQRNKSNQFCISFDLCSLSKTNDSRPASHCRWQIQFPPHHRHWAQDYYSKSSSSRGQMFFSKRIMLSTAVFYKLVHRMASQLMAIRHALLLTIDMDILGAGNLYWVAGPSRYKELREQEQKRPPNGLVKILCLSCDRKARMQHERSVPLDNDRSSWVGSLFVRFSAAWMPLVVEAIRWKTTWWGGGGRHEGAVARSDASHTCSW